MEFSLEEACAVLARTPATLAALLAGLPPAWVLNNEGGESFSPFEVLGHLIDAEQSNWLPRAAMIRDGATNTPSLPLTVLPAANTTQVGPCQNCSRNSQPCATTTCKPCNLGL